MYICAVSGNVLICSYDWTSLFSSFYLCMFVKYLMEKRKNCCVYTSIWPTCYQEQFWTVTLLSCVKENRIEIFTFLCICPHFWYSSKGTQQCFSNCFACGTCNFDIKFHGTVFESLLQIVKAQKEIEESAGKTQCNFYFTPSNYTTVCYSAVFWAQVLLLIHVQ